MNAKNINLSIIKEKIFKSEIKKNLKLSWTKKWYYKKINFFIIKGAIYLFYIKTCLFEINLI